MYKNQYISELPINEVKEYFDELRCNTPWTAEQFADFEMCKERLVVYACKTLEQINVLDKIRTEVADAHLIGYATISGKREIASKAVFDIIDKYREEQKNG